MKGLRLLDKIETRYGELARCHFCFYGNSQSFISADVSQLALDVMTFEFSETKVYIAMVWHSGFVLVGDFHLRSSPIYPSTFDAMFDEADKTTFFTDKDCYLLSVHTSYKETRALQFRLRDILPHITDLSHLSDTQCYEIADAVQEVARKFDQIIYPV